MPVLDMRRSGLYALPEIIQHQIVAFLLGFDVFRLSHMSGEALQLFSHDSFWQSRLPGSRAPTPSLAAPYCAEA